MSDKWISVEDRLPERGVYVEDEDTWVTQGGLTEIFGVTKSTISEHLSNIFEEGELKKDSTVRKSRTVQIEGGYVADGIFLYNHIRGLPIKTVIYNTGSVMSIAVSAFVASDERYCSARSMFLIHPTSMSPQEGMTATRLQSTLDSALADDARTESILRERTSIPADMLDSRRVRDVYITPQDAVSHGIVHGIREFSVPQGVEVIQI